MLITIWQQTSCFNLCYNRIVLILFARFLCFVCLHFVCLCDPPSDRSFSLPEEKCDAFNKALLLKSRQIVLSGKDLASSSWCMRNDTHVKYGKLITENNNTIQQRQQISHQASINIYIHFFVYD